MLIIADEKKLKIVSNSIKATKAGISSTGKFKNYHFHDQHHDLKSCHSASSGSSKISLRRDLIQDKAFFQVKNDNMDFKKLNEWDIT